MLDFFLEFKFVFTALAWGSLALFITSIAIMPWLIAKIPADYFCMQRRTPARLNSRPLPSRVLTYARNVFGCTLVVLGIVMLLLPGQGILTILAGLFLMNFPGKYELECKLVAMPKVLNSLNWIREKARKPPLITNP